MASQLLVCACGRRCSRAVTRSDTYAAGSLTALEILQQGLWLGCCGAVFCSEVCFRQPHACSRVPRSSCYTAIELAEACDSRLVSCLK